jgi:PBP4 family serine-type D-alanyl-D-alanine carboxypeptidase
MPPTAAITIVNHCITSGEKQAPAIKRGAGPTEYIITGTCATRAELQSKPVETPGYFTADAMKTYLATQGIMIDGPIRRAPQRFTNQGEIIATTTSAPMALLIKRVNKTSQNFVAECLAKESGERYRQQRGADFTGASWQAGEAAARAFLTRNHISDAEVFRAADGSGLSRDNRVTARMLTDLLAVMHAHPQAQAFRESLPIAGIDGTLKKRLTDANKGQVQAKTGSIGGVRTLSGYTTMPDGCTLAFSFLCNNIEGDDDEAVKRMDDAIRALRATPQR